MSLTTLSQLVLKRITFCTQEDRQTLLSLSLVNRILNNIASSVLYARICVSSQSHIEELQDFLNTVSVCWLQHATIRYLTISAWLMVETALKEKQFRSALRSSCLPRYTAYVEAFEVTAFVSPESDQKNIARSLEAILSYYTNLRSFAWRPSFCDAELSSEVAQLLPKLPSLKHLSVKVPFFLPVIPKLSSTSQPKPNLDSIAEDDEQEGDGEDVASDVANFPKDERQKEDSSGLGEEDATPYEYKPLEDESGSEIESEIHVPYSIPPPELKKLRSLVLASPTAEVLTHLPTILRSLEQPVRTLCFEENCGSVTPNTLTSLLPAMHELEHFGLGVAYSVKYDNLMPFLERIPNLRTLEVFHYHQLYTKTSPIARLHALKTLKIKHMHTASRAQIVTMCVWIRRIVSNCQLAGLEVYCEDPKDCPPRGPGHGISCDGLLSHLLSRHRETLRVLRTPSLYFGPRAMKELLNDDGDGCKMLEEMGVCVRRQVFDTLSEFSSMAPKLCRIYLTVVNLKKGTKLTIDSGILRAGSTSLRRVQVNGKGVVGEWGVEYYLKTPRLRPKFEISEIRCEEEQLIMQS